MESSPKGVALRWAQAYNRRDAEAAAALYDERVENIQLPYDKPVNGRDAMKATFQRVFLAFPDIEVEVENALEDGEWAVVAWTFRGTMRGEFAGKGPTGRRFTLRGCEMFRVRGGRIVAQRGYWDRSTMFSQLGV